jgi:CheY-like chemotaxis protein
LELPSGRLVVEGDRVRWVELVANLLNNAAKFTDPGGHIALRVLHQGERVEIQVQDDGRGVPGQWLNAEVRVAHAGEKALQLCEDWSPTHVLMDLGMPGMDGYEAARRLRANHPECTLRRVAVSGWGGEELCLQSSDAGFDQHRVKPVVLTELTAGVTN